VTYLAIPISAVLGGLAIGFLGSCPTVSTFSHETLRLADAGSRRTAGAKVAGIVTAALRGVHVGTVLARVL
jgi:fluoride ion exporter CrcB/FEX